MEKIHSNTTRIKSVVAAILAVIAIVVVFQNTGAVHTTVLFGAFTMPLALLLGLTFVSGLLSGAVLLRRWAYRRR